MGLLSILKRNSEVRRDAAATGSASETVQRARVRARQRLIGAVVLVAIGIIGFPLLFESTPRPIPVDIPIEIPARDAVSPLAMPPARLPQDPPASSSNAPKPVFEAPAADAQGAPPRVAGPGPASADKPVGGSPAPVEPAVAPKPAAAVAAPTTAPEARLTDGARAKALLEGKAPPAKDSARYVVQVGAFADSSSAQEVRQKVDKLGVKTYTQVTETSAGNRIRVRMGPFASRDEAEKALAKAKAAGINGVVLTL
ncbi:MAG: SPOR domain-containing protein [Rhizobacter sp.]|nr:SPOR domain-containing protein [Rhizobacter sp.]